MRFALSGPDLFLVLPAGAGGMVLGLNWVQEPLCVCASLDYKMLIWLPTCWGMKCWLMLGKFLYVDLKGIYWSGAGDLY